MRLMADGESKNDHRTRMYALLESSDLETAGARIVATFITTLIVLNVAASILQTVPGVADRFWRPFAIFEAISLMIFSLEYAARMWSAGANPKYSGFLGRIRFALQPHMIIDAIATFPSVLFPAIDFRAIRVLRLFRLLRGLKLVRYSKGLQIMVSVVRERRAQLLLCVGLVAALVVFSASIMFYVERGAQPEHFSSIPASMWWAVSALTTVGYGDVVPVTSLGRLLASIMSVLGVGLFALPAGILASGFAEQMSQESNTQVCQHCGKSSQ